MARTLAPENDPVLKFPFVKRMIRALVNAKFYKILKMPEKTKANFSPLVRQFKKIKKKKKESSPLLNSAFFSSKEEKVKV